MPKFTLRISEPDLELMARLVGEAPDIRAVKKYIERKLETDRALLETLEAREQQAEAEHAQGLQAYLAERQAGL